MKPPDGESDPSLKEPAAGGRLDRDALRARFERVRAQSIALTNPLEIEDQVVQTCDDVSPTKWHLAHTTWFFETFVLVPHAGDYAALDERYAYLFNSYYQAVGPQFSRPHRGHLTRPTVAEAHDYRGHVDRGMQAFFAEATHAAWRAAAPVIELGLHHEQQHQELVLTDIKDVLSRNPLYPAPYSLAADERSEALPPQLGWRSYDGGIYKIGHEPARGFAFDNESPRHEVLLRPFELADRPVTNRDYTAFLADGGYEKPQHWMADGWARVKAEGWTRPRYWIGEDGGFSEYTLAGPVALDPDAPVSHLSAFEALAFADWAGARLPTEFEWEVAATGERPGGHFLDVAPSGARAVEAPHPRARRDAGDTQMFGDVWEWTQSAYHPYPGYKPPAGALGEYNGKFMASQLVLRGGSCATPRDHFRPTYRNFFYPHQRWQFTGVRLARDA